MKILWKQLLTGNNYTSCLTKCLHQRWFHSTVEVRMCLDATPRFIDQRIGMFDELLHQREQVKVTNQKKITVTLPDGHVVHGYSWKTTPYEVAQGISKRLAKEAVLAKVDGVLWDLERPFEADSTVEILKYECPDVQSVFWHSSAHVLGEAMELQYNGLLCYGPPIDHGFYYDMFLSNKQVSSNDFPQLEALIKDIVKQKQDFVRLEMRKEDLLRMFSYNPFKLRILEEKVKTPTTTVYRCGSLIDLCLGPHVRHTGQLKSFTLTKNSAAHWQGNRDAEQLQRIYGISFPNEQLMKQWKRAQAEAAARDHRKIGRDQELFFFHELSPGSCFFLPDGAHIYNKLIEFLREEYCKYGYEEVVTPNIYSTKLWEKSGHWQHYSENMFSFDVEDEKYALKPMNCPGHCLVFDTRPRSWRELPIRMADFGVLHRNELSGTLGGLTRVRRFQQDDAHIFCTLEQVQEEIKGCLEFLQSVYNVFGFSFGLKLATRPDKYMGSLDTWENAEKQLEKSLNDFGLDWQLNEGDGAFYGPKIDIELRDALGRSHQCATIQLDFQLPERFGLSYVTDANEARTPVMIHRAILGSVERMIAILTESYAGKWPFWLSPRQAIVIPVSTKYDEYATRLANELAEKGFKVCANVNVGELLSKKIRNAHLKQYNYVLVVGEKELQSNSVTLRPRDSEMQEEKYLPELIDLFHTLNSKKERE